MTAYVVRHNPRAYAALPPSSDERLWRGALTRAGAIGYGFYEALLRPSGDPRWLALS